LALPVAASTWSTNDDSRAAPSSIGPVPWIGEPAARAAVAEREDAVAVVGQQGRGPAPVFAHIDELAAAAVAGYAAARAAEAGTFGRRRHRLQTNRGSAPDVAARRGIHPQTARQQLHQVQRLSGPALADPDARFELEVALRSGLMASAVATAVGAGSRLGV
jgi:PucR C-terminal helix-turn-helix domain